MSELEKAKWKEKGEKKFITENLGDILASSTRTQVFDEENTYKAKKGDIYSALSGFCTCTHPNRKKKRVPKVFNFRFGIPESREKSTHTEGISYVLTKMSSHIRWEPDREVKMRYSRRSKKNGHKFRRSEKTTIWPRKIRSNFFVILWTLI